MPVENPSFGKRAEQFAAHASTRVIMTRLEKKIIGPVHPEYAPGFAGEYAAAIQEGYIPLLVVAPHEAHADGIPFGKVTKALTRLTNVYRPADDKLKGFYLPIATSMATGNQNEFLREMVLQTEQLLASHNLNLLTYTRKKDNEQYGLPENPIEFLRQVRGVAAENYGLALLPEATIEGGRPKNGSRDLDDINGMQEFDENAIATMMRTITSVTKRPVVIIPVIIRGGHNLQDTRRGKNIPRLGAVAALANPFDTQFVTVKVALPIRGDELVTSLKDQGLVDGRGNVLPEAINEELGLVIASEIPESQRGVWTERVAQRQHR